LSTSVRDRPSPGGTPPPGAATTLTPQPPLGDSEAPAGAVTIDQRRHPSAFARTGAGPHFLATVLRAFQAA
jgi:hypothetical protein